MDSCQLITPFQKRLDSNYIMRPLTLHVRLTKACNANCTYCSSFENNPDKFMSLNDFIISIENIWGRISGLGISPSYINMEYVGGEILLVPFKVLESQVNFARSFFHERGVLVRDGVQTNLIGSRSKVSELYDLFDGRMGTSIDSFTDQRRIDGDHKRYKVIMLSREKSILGDSHKFPGVFTIDSITKDFVSMEIKKASRDNRNLTIRPVFSGGSPVKLISSEDLALIMAETFNLWFMKMNIVLEPHFSLFKNRFENRFGINSNFERSYCSFQSDCASKSVSLEPDGDVYVCQELADMGYGKLGNAILNEWDNEMWDSLSARSSKLSRDCLNCDYYKECQGGCMMQSLDDGNGIYGKPEYCLAWKRLFSEMDNAINSVGFDRINNWLNRLSIQTG